MNNDPRNLKTKDKLNSNSEEEETETGQDSENALRRSLRQTSKPKYLEEYTVLAMNAEMYVEDIPESYEDI